MKILAPLRSPPDVEPLLAAGAEEFYCGLTPPDWAERYPGDWPSKRNPNSAGVANGQELREITRLAGSCPVFVTLNAPQYRDGMKATLLDFGRRLIEEDGVSALIVADMDLLLALVAAGLAGRVHVSSLAVIANPGALEFLRELGIARAILPRHLTVEEIERIHVPGIETEAFLLNDGCAFEEGLCATTHAAGAFCIADVGTGAPFAMEVTERYAFWKWTLGNCGCQTSRGFQLGPCGLCAVPRLLAAGVASLKIVGREAPLDRRRQAVRLAATALKLAQAGASAEGIRTAVIDVRGAPQLCDEAHLCYYPDVWISGRQRSRRAC
jgi:U32 family peptidase